MSSDSNVRDRRRRRLLKAAAVASGTFLAGCSGQQQQAPTSGNGTTGGTGGSGGSNMTTMRFADTAPPGSLDPHAFNPSTTTALFAYPENGYEPLLYYPPKLKEVSLKPVLAKKVPSAENGLITNNGRTIEFPLREGVKFHTGGEMLAEDVKYSWNRAITMGLGPNSQALKTNIKSMEVTDDYRFRVTLKNPNTPVFFNSVVTQPIATVASKKAVEEHGGVQAGKPNQWMAQNSAGTGPYKLGKKTPSRLIWEAHENYWGRDKSEYYGVGVDRVIQRFVKSASTRAALLRKGDVDYAFTNVSDYKLVKGSPNIDVLKRPQINPSGMIFNFNIPYDRPSVQEIAGNDTVPPDFFQDIHVRKGFAYAIDYKSVIEDILGGLGTRINQIHVPGTFGYDKDAPRFQRDPKKAEEHFRKAGYWNKGFRVTLHNENLTEFNRMNLLFKDNIESLNDNFTIHSVTEPESKAAQRHSADPPGWPFEVHGLLPIGADPTPYYKHYCHPEGNLGARSGVEKAITSEIPKLIDRSATETNPDERTKIFKQLQQLCFEDPAMIATHAPTQVRATKSCMEITANTAWRQPHFKHWNMKNC